jgi:hypothetical protein
VAASTKLSLYARESSKCRSSDLLGGQQIAPAERSGPRPQVRVGR